MSWIPLDKGMYPLDRAVLIAGGIHAAALTRSILEVYLDRFGTRRMRGSGLVYNHLLVRLLEDHDEIDLALDLGGEFKFMLRNPNLTAGKVFAPDVQSAVHFVPRNDGEKMAVQDFENLFRTLRFVSPSEP